MRINLAHLREPSTSGGWIDFAVFGARSSSGLDSDNAALLARVTAQARSAGYKIDQSALAYDERGQIRFYGDKNLVDYLSQNGLPQWTHSIDG